MYIAALKCLYISVLTATLPINTVVMIASLFIKPIVESEPSLLNINTTIHYWNAPRLKSVHCSMCEESIDTMTELNVCMHIDILF